MCHCCNRLSIKSKCNMGQKNSVPRDYMYFDFISNLYPTVCHISKFCFLCMPELHKVIFGNWIRRLRSVQPAGLLIFCGKKAKFRGIFRGKFAEKSANFAGFLQGKQVEIRKKIGRFRWGLVAKCQISKDFQGQIRGKIGRFHGKFQRETSPRNNQG